MITRLSCWISKPLIFINAVLCYETNAQCITADRSLASLSSETCIESAFSPELNAEKLVLKAISSSVSSIRLAAYSFTSPTIVAALIEAKKRGVDVKVVVDEKGNQSKASVAALNVLMLADIPTRVISNYSIHHDKYIIIDELHVQTGSFNYSRAAAKSNSENVIVVWNNSKLASSYMTHWQSRFDQANTLKISY